MFPCRRCGLNTPRLTVDQIHCPRCTAEVAAIIASDTRRRSVVRFQRARDMRGVAA